MNFNTRLAQSTHFIGEMSLPLRSAAILMQLFFKLPTVRFMRSSI